MEAAAPRLYRSGVHQDARMHSGRHRHRQHRDRLRRPIHQLAVVQHARDGHVPLMFAVKAGNVGAAAANRRAARTGRASSRSK